MPDILTDSTAETGTLWITDPGHRAALLYEARRQFDFFAASVDPKGGFDTLDFDGKPLPGQLREIHTVTRMVHSYALAQMAGIEDAEQIVDHGLSYLLSHHRDPVHGGFVWGVQGDAPADDRKLAYGHAFVLLAAASAIQAGHAHAEALLDEVWQVLDEQYWEEDHGLFADEWNRDWTPFSTYRGMNANMHSIEALLTAYEATGRAVFLERAGRILDFFVNRIAPAEGWRLPEHYDANWQVDRAYSGNPMFRPAGSTPGHSFELGRLLLQYWDLRGRPEGDAPQNARRLIEQALTDSWNTERGGFAYTLGDGGTVAIADRYWWPVTEAIGGMAALVKLDARPEDEAWYRRLWGFAHAHLIDHDCGGWFPELDANNKTVSKQFMGKPDIYHSVQAALFPLAAGLSRNAADLKRLDPQTAALR
ncbi:AGE family epimerase/isomerase [Tritonibacter scottomollicae]|uniref:AGE family epimerase/isomerase n=1 Tax=Tritonibacter scottomollicae TaxID=483013 RepID=UPI003AA9B235